MFVVGQFVVRWGDESPYYEPIFLQCQDRQANCVKIGGVFVPHRATCYRFTQYYPRLGFLGKRQNFLLSQHLGSIV